MLQVGDRVARGQALATLDKAELELRLALVRAQYDEAVAREQSAAAQLTLASQEVKRLSGLSRQDAVSRASIDDADQQQNIAGARLRESRAAVARASAALQLAALERDYATVQAPFAGGITETLSEVGGYLRRGDAVVKMVSERRMEVEAAVPAQYLGGAVIGATVPGCRRRANLSRNGARRGRRRGTTHAHSTGAVGRRCIGASARRRQLRRATKRYAVDAGRRCARHCVGA